MTNSEAPRPAPDEAQVVEAVRNAILTEWRKMRGEPGLAWATSAAKASIAALEAMRECIRLRRAKAPSPDVVAALRLSAALLQAAVDEEETYRIRHNGEDLGLHRVSDVLDLCDRALAATEDKP